MEHLHNAIPVWPPVLEQADAIKKHTLAVNLKRISQERNLHHPRSYLLTEQKPTSAEWERKMWVLKREHSECTENVKLPKDNETLTLEIRRKLLQDRYMWLAQEYMPLLRDIGEWRVIVVGGRVENVVFTHPLDSGRVAFVVVDHFKTLPDMQ
jgi:glutathione synthase/RimK-type ligase-like ATP-grasp enzyme